MIYLICLFAVLVLPYQTYIHFAAVMRLKEVQDAGKLSGFNKVMGKAALYTGYPLDFLFNVIFGTLMYVDIPHEFLFTRRCERMKTSRFAFRRAVANFWCSQLSAIDPSGDHCKGAAK